MMITEGLNVLRTIKSKKLWQKFNELHLEKIISKCLLKTDTNEFAREWSKLKAINMMVSHESDESEEDPEKLIDMDGTITEESKLGSLESKKDFLIRVLKQKLLKLGDKQKKRQKE